MGATERRKGNKAEQDVARFLRSQGFKATTSRSEQGFQGGSDIVTNLPLAIEVKDHARLDLSGWWAQASAQADGDELPVILHKRRGFADPGRWWCTMDGHTFAQIMRGSLLRH